MVRAAERIAARQRGKDFPSNILNSLMVLFLVIKAKVPLLASFVPGVAGLGEQTEAEGAAETAKPPSRVIGREKKVFFRCKKREEL